MGKKGKKKGKNEGESEDGPSQPVSQPQPQQQQQQQQQPQQQQQQQPQQQPQQRPQQQQPQQQREAPVAQAAESFGQLNLGDNAGRGRGRGDRGRGGDDRGRGGGDRGRGGGDRGRGGGDRGRGRGGPGRDQDPIPSLFQSQPGGQGQRGPGWGPPPGVAPVQAVPQGQPPGQGQRGPGWGPPPGVAPAQAVPQGQAPGQGQRGPGWGAQAQAQMPGVGQQSQVTGVPSYGPPPGDTQVPGMPAQSQGARGRGGQGQGRGGQGRGGQQQGRGGQQQGYGGQGQGGQQRAPSPARSTASSAAGDTASVKSAGSGKSDGKKPAAQAGLGASPVKTSLSTELQATYINQIPKRKNPNKGGTAGRPITVETNMIPIIFGRNFKTTVTHYDVKLDPDKPRFMYRPVVEAVRAQHYPHNFPVFDGRCNVFSAGPLPFGDRLHTEIEVMNPQRLKTMSFKVTLIKAQDIDMSWLPNVRPGFQETQRSQIAIQALDVILRAAPLRQKAISVGRSFFTPPPGRAVDLGNGMDLWIGTFQSAVLGWKPYFNVDVAHKAFPRNQRVIDLFNELCGDSRSGQPATLRDIEYGRRKLTDYLKGLKVTYEIPGHPTSKRTMGINDLGKNSKDATFELQDGTVTTVENYFAREKRYKIRYPDYPTLWVGSRNKTVLIPAELCIIEAGQVTNKKMDERQTSTMIKYAATNTSTRKQKIMDGFSQMRSNEDPAMKEFGISVGGGFETVKARVLNPPSLFDKANIAVRKGVWRAGQFHTASQLPERSWTILNLDDRTQEGPLRAMVGFLRNGGRAVGMDIGEPLTPFKNMRAPMRDVREIIQFFIQKKEEGLKLIIVVVPDKTGPVYGKVKQVAELNVGVLTQCIKAITVQRKMNDATAGNILLKINSKLNGTNQIFAAGKNPPCLNKPCMIVGADVTHPSPDAVGIPSIAAVAASHGPRAFRYNVKIRLQPPKTEIILHLEEIMKDQLMFFYKSTGHKPERIIFYRDGVSEGQFPQVMHHELQAIRNACKRLGGANKYEPKITFLVVQKRHHIRLFPTDSRNSDDRNGNVQAGTVVDTEITHPSHIDFYLVSHASIQGTARPTKYRCLWDDSDMSEDEIEQLTYYLCHMFSRCTRSVSYPAPTYYAHLAAFRARALTNEVDIRLNNLEEEQRTKMTIKDEILLGNPMFFV